MAINTNHAAYDRNLPKWARCRDAADGQDAIHDKGDLYLPRLREQDGEEYEAYKKRATFFNATWRTVAGLSGMLFRKEPVVAVPASITPLLDTLSSDGMPVHMFVAHVAEEVLTTGRVGVMVDFPQVVDVSRLTQADAQLLNLRPTMCSYRAESIINWGERVINNKCMLSFVVVVEDNELPGDDEFSKVCERQYRILDLEPTTNVYRQRLYRIDKDTGQPQQIGEDVYPMMQNKKMPFIPFYFIGACDVDPDVDPPPLIDLVDINLAHYRVTADYEHGCHFTGLPTGYVTGYKKDPKSDEKFYLGAQHMLTFPHPETKVAFLEFSGEGLGALEKNLERKEMQMAILGARMLEVQKKGVESADTASIHRSGEQATLASIAIALSLGFKKALQTFSDWAGGSGDVEFDINRDFFPMPMDPQALTAYVNAWLQGGISKQTLFFNLKNGEVTPTGVTFEEEEARISNGAPLSGNPLTLN